MVFPWFHDYCGTKLCVTKLFCYFLGLRDCDYVTSSLENGDKFLFFTFFILEILFSCFKYECTSWIRLMSPWFNIGYRSLLVLAIFLFLCLWFLVQSGYPCNVVATSHFPSSIWGCVPISEGLTMVSMSISSCSIFRFSAL